MSQREQTLKKIKEYEKKGWWDKDVEDDPPTLPLLPNQVNYLNKGIFNKIATHYANKLAIKFFDKQIEQKNLIIKEVVGLENYEQIKNDGAILTCNHFNPFDNYAVFKTIQKQLGKKHLYKVIREGNYTNFKGFYGYLFKHCNTLPLSSNTQTMKKFLQAISVLLERKEKILIYPEQAMWWNYRKPRPMQDGAFKIAAKNNVPILPFFITMTDSDKKDEEGFFVQEYTVHISKPIYPSANKNQKEQSQELKQKNYEVWKDIYQNFYKKSLEY